MNPAKDRSTPLTRDELFSAALRIVDEEGLEALTMRHLAQVVGVKPMSLYHHVPNKEALLDGVVECVITGMRVAEPRPSNWMDLLEAMVSELRRALIAHPNVLPLVAQRPPSTPSATPYMRVPLQVLAQAGLPAQDVVALYQSLLAFTFGHSMLTVKALSIPEEAAGELAERLKEWDEATFRRSTRALLREYAASSEGAEK